MSKSLNSDIEHRLETYRDDFEVTTGHPFANFFCPILAVDEPLIELQSPSSRVISSTNPSSRHPAHGSSVAATSITFRARSLSPT